MKGHEFSRASSITGPSSPEDWKRIVYKHAPRHFYVELLSPEKLAGNSHSYGIRVHPMNNHGTSISSGQSARPYDIWRKWEDCLLYQETLEVTYSRAAREKRSRLAAGKGVKKNGVYIHSDQAASWDSLPFGPNPNDIAYDIHHYIPMLTKKGTFFRASQETVDHRYHDLEAMLRALFQEDLPTLIKEIKETSTFTDFFGVWRRDIDLARKTNLYASDCRRTSFSSSIFSVFPGSSISHSKASCSIKGKSPQKTHATSVHSDSSEDAVDLPRSGRSLDRRQNVRLMNPRASSSRSRSSSSAPSTPVTVPRQLSPTSRQQPVVASQEPTMFGHTPHVLGDERSNLESLPEDRELSSSPKSDQVGVLSRRRTLNRNAKVYVPSPTNSEQSPPSSARYSRSSLLSTHSSTTVGASAYLDELGVDYCLPNPTAEPGHYRPRASVSSLASFMTNTSVDAVIPHGERPSRTPVNNTSRRREYGPWSEDESDDQGDILDAYFKDLIVPRSGDFPETPTVDDHFIFSPDQSSVTISSFSSYSNRRSSWTTSISSGSTSSSGNPAMLSIKAMHEDSIVMIRLPRNVTFEDLRRKIYDKFVQTDKPTICETFAIALMEQTPTEEGLRSASSESAHTNKVALHFISSQGEWDEVAATQCGKTVLRIIGSKE